MNNARPLVLALATALVLSACGSGEPPTPPAAPAEPAASTAPAEPAAAEPAAAEIVSSGASIGIAACDDYLTNYERCVADKVPADTRAVLKVGLDQTREAWRAAVAAGTSTSDLEAACKTMNEGARASMAAFGCEGF